MEAKKSLREQSLEVAEVVSSIDEEAPGEEVSLCDIGGILLYFRITEISSIWRLQTSFTKFR